MEMREGPEINASVQIIPSPEREGCMRATTKEAFIAWAQNPGRRFPLTVFTPNGDPTELGSANQLANEPSVYGAAIKQFGYVDFKESN